LSTTPSTQAPSVLLLADRWAKAMGKSTKVVDVQDADGGIVPVLVVMHGDKPVLVRSRGECVSIFLLMDIPKDIADRIHRYPGHVQKRVLAALRYELLSHARTAFALRPEPLGSIAELQRIRVEQLVRISEDDPSSFNRYSDAIQEIVTTTARVFSVLAPVLPTGGDAHRADGDKAAPSSMYA